jgi:negative regulator of replication initiation
MTVKGGVMVTMPTIRIDEDVWAFLKTKAKPFEDTPNDVLRRELGLNGSPDIRVVEENSPVMRASTRSDESLIPRDADYSHQRVTGYGLDEKHYNARSFKDVLIGVSTKLRCKHLDAFDKAALGLHGKKRFYFSRDPKDLRYPHRLADSNIFVETNLNANLIVGICRALLEALGHDIGEFVVD